MLKKLLLVTIVILIAAGGQGVQLAKAGKIPTKFEYSVCDTPIYYKIGEVDEKFGVKREKLLSSVNRAAQIWSKEAHSTSSGQAGRNLFLYGPSKEGALTINFKYDKRQALTTQITQLEGKVYKDEGSLKNAMDDYEAKVASLNSRLEAFNKEVQEWNDKGGAPPEVYERLRSEQVKLQEEGASLSILAQELNISVEKYNSQVGKLNTTIESFNTELARRPEEGLFDSGENRIEIFFFANQTELLHTLAHEFGHARGLEHVDNEEAIMFPFTTNVLKPSEEDSAQLAEICRERNVLDETLKQGKTVVERYKLLLEEKIDLRI